MAAGRDAGPDAHHAALVDALRAAGVAPAPVLDAFARVPRHHFLPGVDPQAVYADAAIVTRAQQDGIPVSSSSQPSLMAAMLGQLEVRPGDRVLEVGAGTGFNAALLAELGASVTAVELDPEVADAARANLAAAGVGEVEVVTGDGARPPGGPYDRVIVTASCWALPDGLVGALADGGVLVAPLRLNGAEVVMPLRRAGARLAGAGAVPCAFMPLRGSGRPWRWELGAGGVATADTDLGDEGRGAVDRLLASPPASLDPQPPLWDHTGLRHALDALLWLGLQGDPILTLLRSPAKHPRPSWVVALASLPASLLVLDLDGRTAELRGRDAALRACLAGLESWTRAGKPTTAQVQMTIEPHAGRDLGGLPAPLPAGGAELQRGHHRWTVRYMRAP